MVSIIIPTLNEEKWKKKLIIDVRVENMDKSKLRTIIELVVFGIATMIGMLIIMRYSI